MRLVPSDDQRAIIEVSAQLIAKQAPIATLRRNRDSPQAFDRESWHEFAELGWFGLGLPAQVGGAELALTDEALLFGEVGRGLVPGPVLGSTMGAHIATAAGELVVARSIVEGRSLVGFGAGATDCPIDADGRVHGAIDLIDAAGCEYVAVVSPSGAALARISDLSNVQSRRCVDPGTRLAKANAESVTPVAYVPATHAPLWQRAVVLTAALGVGVSEAARDMALHHAKNRQQFGRPIGANQAIKHTCVDMAVRSHAARAQLFYAAASFVSQRPDARLQAVSARVVAVTAALDNGAANVQVNGGMGFTNESDAHLYLKRARVLEHVVGSQHANLERLLEEDAAI